MDARSVTVIRRPFSSCIQGLCVMWHLSPLTRAFYRGEKKELTWEKGEGEEGGRGAE